MLYNLFDWLIKHGYKFPGIGLLQFITLRVLLSVIVSLLVTTFFGKKMIGFLQRKQVGESVRDLGLMGEQQKMGTPTMGGVIIILAILIPTLLFADLHKVYIRLMILCSVWLGAMGFLDDYLKISARQKAKAKGVVYKKADSDGLAGKFKIFGQVMLGIIVGATLYFSNSVTVKREIIETSSSTIIGRGERKLNEDTVMIDGKPHRFVSVKTPITTIPFVKNHEFNYAKLLPAGLAGYTYIIYIIIVI